MPMKHARNAHRVAPSIHSTVQYIPLQPISPGAAAVEPRPRARAKVAGDSFTYFFSRGKTVSHHPTHVSLPTYSLFNIETGHLTTGATLPLSPLSPHHHAAYFHRCGVMVRGTVSRSKLDFFFIVFEKQKGLCFHIVKTTHQSSSAVQVTISVPTVS